MLWYDWWPTFKSIWEVHLIYCWSKILAKMLAENRETLRRFRIRFRFRRTSGSGPDIIYDLSHFQNDLYHLCRSNIAFRRSILCRGVFWFLLSCFNNFPLKRGPKIGQNGNQIHLPNPPYGVVWLGEELLKLPRGSSDQLLYCHVGPKVVRK